MSLHSSFKPKRLVVTELRSMSVLKGHAGMAEQGFDVFDSDILLSKTSANSTVSVHII